MVAGLPPAPQAIGWAEQEPCWGLFGRTHWRWRHLSLGGLTITIEYYLPRMMFTTLMLIRVFAGAHHWSSWYLIRGWIFQVRQLFNLGLFFILSVSKLVCMNLFQVPPSLPSGVPPQTSSAQVNTQKKSIKVLLPSIKSLCNLTM